MSRFALPAESYGDVDAAGKPSVPKDYVHWPLYSSIAIDGAVLPRELSWFTYVRGQTVAGAGGAAITATPFHCNNLLQNSIPRPKTFTCTGVRLLLSPLDYTAGAPTLDYTSATTALVSTQVDQPADMALLFQSSWFELRQGEIEEVLCPAYALPCNMGIRGISATSVNSNAAVVLADRFAITTVGRGWDLRRRPFVLWNQQFFEAKLRSEWATRPTIRRDRLLFNILDGIIGREYQG